MNKFKFYFIALSAAVVLFSCNKADAVDYEILHEYGTQYENDLAVIVDYLHGHYISSYINHPGFSDDQDVVISKITNAAEQQSLWDSPLLHSIDVARNDITYKVYYLQLREGDAVNGKNPSRVDNILVSYEGTYLRLGEEPTLFDSKIYPDGYFALNSLIVGWSEIMPLFKTGVFNQAASEGGPAVYDNFGAGVMFLPSGLGYYNTALATIPAYAQLMFKFKLYDLKRADQDNDGILSNDEDLNHNGIFTDDDTDGDGIQNYLDTDDDGDGYLTKIETQIPGTGSGTPYPAAYYPYDGAAVDDPATPQIDETQGIPRKFTGPEDPITHLNTPGPGDFTDPARLRRNLDVTATPPFQ